MNVRKPLLLGAFVLALALPLAACGGDDDGSEVEGAVQTATDAIGGAADTATDALGDAGDATTDALDGAGDATTDALDPADGTDGSGDATGTAAPVTVQLDEQNGSGVSGTATLTEAAEGTTVLLELTGSSSGGPHPAHVHDGSCAELGDIAYPLTDVSSGGTDTAAASSDTDSSSVTDTDDPTTGSLMSETPIEASLAELGSGQFAINVHESAESLDVYVACGDVTATDATTTSGDTTTPTDTPPATDDSQTETTPATDDGQTDTTG